LTDAGGLRELLRQRGFVRYWAGVVASQVGTRGAAVATYYQVYELTGSIVYTGLLGAAQAISLLGLSPVGGALADRYDRRRLLQISQAAALVVSTGLAWLTLFGLVEAWHVLVAAVLVTAAASFDQPARQALIPALVPRGQIGPAIALLNPSRELAQLAGPLVAGLLIAIGGPGLVYGVDAVTYGGLVVVLATLRIPAQRRTGSTASVYAAIVEGARYVRRRPLIYHLMAVDLSATVFAGYRVLLPALAIDVLGVGPAGYGVISAAPSAGALLNTWVVWRTVRYSARQGRILLGATVLYGAAAILLAQSPWLGLAVAAGLLLGACDAMATTIRHAAVQLDTPDELRGRVTSLYQMSSRGGPAIGDLWVGALAGVIGPVAALTLGAFAPIVIAAAYWNRGAVLRTYRGVVEPEPS
jgi:MFS family permease